MAGCNEPEGRGRGWPPDYAKAEAVHRLLRKFYNAARQTGWGACLLGGEVFRSRPEGLRPDMFERQVVLAVDGERFLMGLGTCERWAVAAIALQGHTERTVARRYGTSPRSVSRAYWRGIDELYEKFVACGYVARVADDETQVQATGKLPSEAEEASGGSSVEGLEAGVAGVGT